MPAFDVTVYIVLDDFERSGRVFREINEEDGGLEAVIGNLSTGQYNNPIRVVAFNTSEGWSRDVSEDVAWELLRRVIHDQKQLPAAARAFVEFHVGEEETLRAEAGLL